jgi:excisionase family DNA binding protein
LVELNTANEAIALAYTIPDLLKLLGVGRTHLYCQINSGALPARKVGRRTLVLHEDVQAFLRNLPTVR